MGQSLKTLAPNVVTLASNFLFFFINVGVESCSFPPVLGEGGCPLKFLSSQRKLNPLRAQRAKKNQQPGLSFLIIKVLVFGALQLLSRLGYKRVVFEKDFIHLTEFNPLKVQPNKFNIFQFRVCVRTLVFYLFSVEGGI